LDASMRIIISCDMGGVSEAARELLCICRERCEELAIAIMNIVTQPKFKEMMSKISDIYLDTIDPKGLNLLDRQRAWHKNRNNYRKVCCLPLMRRPRCRWRTRESRRNLDGVSPGDVVLDNEGSCEDAES